MLISLEFYAPITGISGPAINQLIEKSRWLAKIKIAGDKTIDLDAIINNVFLGDSNKSITTKNRPEVSPAPG